MRIDCYAVIIGNKSRCKKPPRNTNLSESSNNLEVFTAAPHQLVAFDDLRLFSCHNMLM